ncbi:hypothetical protein AYI70_g10985 [Smittium culicis]|uniref:Uncharacterized protein n=1 Tax=Smittium culicis TaxID=133412 RepID=A0A1R1X3W2_9FUNG|nr:hypothetical protein AYI70_g10985 [Smittium culicis]
MTSFNFISFLSKYYSPKYVVAPKEISVSSQPEIKRILSSYKYPKTKPFKAEAPLVPSIFTTSEEDLNRMRRRQVGPAFSITGLESVQDTIVKVGISSLKAKIDQNLNQSISKSYLFNYCTMFQNLTTDIIGELCYGSSFGAIQSGDSKLIDWSNSAIMVFGIVSHISPINYHKYSL